MKKNNMVKKFKEYIEEGFMTKSLNRDKSGEKRLEDYDIYPKEDKYIKLFLKKNNLSNFDELRHKDNAIKDLEKYGYWNSLYFDIVMISIGILIEKYPNIDFSGKFFYSGNCGYILNNNQHILYLKCPKDYFDEYKIYWGSNGKINFKYNFSDDALNLEIKKENSVSIIDFIVESFDDINDKIISYYGKEI